jgi:hypothetical protein
VINKIDIGVLEMIVEIAVHDPEARSACHSIYFLSVA